MKVKNTAYVFIVGLVLLGASLGVYWAIHLREVQTTRALANAQSQTAKIRLSLVNHRSANTQYIGLNPKLAIFSNEQPQVLIIMQTSLAEIEEITGNNENLSSSFLVRSDVKKLIAEKDAQLNNYINRLEDVVNSQKDMMNLIDTINTGLIKFLEYNPVMNLGDLELGEDIEFSKEAVSVTVHGMKESMDSFKELNINTSESREFVAEFDSVLAILNRISAHLEAGDVASAERTKSEFVQEYFTFKKEAFDVQLDVFRSEKAVDNLRELTNIMGGLEEIEEELEKAQGISPIGPM